VVAVGGVLLVDPKHVLPGRGAYLHCSEPCLDQALKRRAIGRALRTSVEVAGVTMIVATCGVASGPVLPHDQPERATMNMVGSVRAILDMSAPRRSLVP